MTQLELPFDDPCITFTVDWNFLQYLGIFELTVTLLVDGDFPFAYARYEGRKRKGIVRKLQEHLYEAYRTSWFRPYGEAYETPDCYVCYLVD